MKILLVFTAIFSFTTISCVHHNSNDYAIYDKNGKIIGGNPNYKSRVDGEAVRSSVRSSATELKECYQGELKMSPEAKGKIVMHFEVKSDVISSIDMNSNAGSFSESMIECIKNSLKNKKYPQAPAGSYYEVTYPFIFGKKD